jgi:hypothetical protein
MAGRILVVSALVALARAKAIITNQCPHTVYVWSVPSVGSADTNNVPIYPGGRYEERWRYGTTENPGIALKVSTQHNGINTGMDEVNFAYSVDPIHKTSVWVDLSPVRGKPFHDNFSFHTCRAVETSVDPNPAKCQIEENIELVLCGFQRTVSATDTFNSQALSECFDYHHDNDKYDHSTSSKPHAGHSTTHHTVYATGTVTTHTTLTKPTTTTQLVFVQPTTVTRHEILTIPVAFTTHTTVTKPGYNHTVTYHQPPQYTPPYQHTSKPYSKPTQYTPIYSWSSSPAYSTSRTSSAPYTSQSYWSPPQHTTSQTYSAPHSSQQHWSPPHHVTSQTYPLPPTYSTPQTHPAPHTSQPYWSPPTNTTSQAYPAPYSSQSHWSPPAYTTSQAYSVPYTSQPYWSPPHYSSTSTKVYSSPHTPSYHPHGGRPEMSSRYTGTGNYDAPRPTGYSDDSHGRIAQLIWDQNQNYTIPSVNGTVASGDQARIFTTLGSHDYCKPKVVYPKAFNQAKISGPSPQNESMLEDKPKKCVLPFCEPAQIGVPCSVAEEKLEEKDLWLIDWTTDEDTCAAFLIWYWRHH